MATVTLYDVLNEHYTYLTEITLTKDYELEKMWLNLIALSQDYGLENNELYYASDIRIALVQETLENNRKIYISHPQLVCDYIKSNPGYVLDPKFYVKYKGDAVYKDLEQGDIVYLLEKLLAHFEEKLKSIYIDSNLEREMT